jgi:hypothetical protein
MYGGYPSVIFLYGRKVLQCSVSTYGFGTGAVRRNIILIIRGSYYGRVYVVGEGIYGGDMSYGKEFTGVICRMGRNFGRVLCRGIVTVWSYDQCYGVFTGMKSLRCRGRDFGRVLCRGIVTVWSYDQCYGVFTGMKSLRCRGRDFGPVSCRGIVTA